MPPAVGGSIESVTLDGRNFAVASDAEAQRKPGGFENEVMANGDGTARLIKTRVPLSYTGLVLEVNDSKDDEAFIQDLANRKDFFPITVTHASGFAFSASAQIVGENPTSSQSATKAIDLAGPGVITIQS